MLYFRGFLCVFLDCDPFDKNLIGLALPLLFPLNQANAFHRVQLCQQPHSFVAATAYVLAHFVHGVVDVDPSGIIAPAVLSGQAHAVQQHTIQQLGSCGKSLEAGIINKLAGHFEKRKLSGFIAAKIV